MTVSYKKSGADGAAYYTNCMTGERVSAVDDYYTGSAKEPPGVWYVGPDASGSRISMLGIEDRQGFQPAVFGQQDSDVEKFARLIQGRHAVDDSPLVQNVGSDKRVAFHDFTLSAPKSVSVVWSQADTELKSAIESAQLESSRAFIDFMSSKSFTRAGKEGVIKLAAPLRGALFPHGSSRENDPQLHTHSVMMNVCEREDGKTSALETTAMMRWTGSAASLYHADLAWKMRQLGFQIQRQDKLFEIKGVPDNVLQQFSKRRAQIVKAVERRQAELGMTVDAKRAAKGLLSKVTIETRTEKNELTREQLQSLWNEEGKSLGFTQKEVDALIGEIGTTLNDDEIYEEALNAIDELTQTDAVFAEPAVLTAVAVRLQGQASIDQIQDAVNRLKSEYLMVSRAEKITQGDFRVEESADVFTTLDMIGIEKRMLELSVRQDERHILTDIQLPESLDVEQRAAAQKACTDTNGVTVIEGAAGAGKTFTMASIARNYEREGYSVTGLSSSWAAALNLRNAAQLADGRAITGWVNDVRKGKIELNDKSLIVVDEAGMVGARDMHNVLELADRAGAKVILLGDTLQQKSVASGDSLQCISKEIGSSRINIIRRQKDNADRAAVNQFFDGQAADGLAHYRNQGSVKILSSADATHAEMVKRWSSLRADHDNKTHLMLATDRKSVAELNRLAHEARRDSGELDEGILVENMDCTKGQQVEFSVGDEVVIRANNKEIDVFNRTRGTVESVQGRIIKVRTESGLVSIGIDDKKWQHKDGGLAMQHAYATTVYSSQGLTVDYALVKDTISLTRKSAGVAMSRHREKCEVFIDKQARHEEAMSRLKTDEWKPLREFTDEECLAQVANKWSRTDNSVSTLDHQNWQNPQGLPVKVQDEADVLTLERASALAQDEIERIRQMSKTGEASLELPFQRAPAYRLPEPELDRAALIRACSRLEDDDIEPEVIEEAFTSGAMSLDEQGEPVFCGRNSDGDLVHVMRDDKAEPTLMRERFAPVLAGDPDRVEVVRSGREALHLQSLQLRAEMRPATVIVSAGDSRSLGMPATRKAIDEAREVKRHDTSEAQAGAGKEPPIVSENRAQAEAQRIAQEQEQARQAASRRGL